MTTHAHSLNLTAGWYGNNCICSDHCSTPECYQGDVDSTVDVRGGGVMGRFTG